MNIFKNFINIAHAHGENDSLGHHMFFDGGSMGTVANYFFLNFFRVIIWLLVIAGIVYLIYYLSKQKKEQSSLEILKERYAKGELSKEEFEKMKKDLS